MEQQRPGAPLRKVQVRRGGGIHPRRVVAVGSHPPQRPGVVEFPDWTGGGDLPRWTGGGDTTQWTGAGRNLQYSSGDDLGLPGGGGGVQPPPAMASLAGGDLEFPSEVPYPTANGFFSNMMMDDTNIGDFDNSDNAYDDQQSQAMPVAPSAPSARPNHKRQKNFSDHEDEVLVSAWLNISLDPIVAKDQKVGRYWSRISEYFHTHKTCQSQRTINSLMLRWETIQRCVNNFCGCLARIELRRQSGTTMPDKVAEACALYKSEDRHQKAFQFMHCWNKLRTQPKWLAKLDELAAAKAAAKTCNKKQKTTSTADPSATLPSELEQGKVEGLEANALTRPIGKKKAKAALVQEKKKSVTTTLDSCRLMYIPGVHTLPCRRTILPPPMHAINRPQHSRKTSTLSNCK